MVQRVSAGYHRGENEQPHETCPAMTEFVLRYDESPVTDAVTPAFSSLLVARTISVLLRVSTCTYMYMTLCARSRDQLASQQQGRWPTHQSPKHMHRIEDGKMEDLEYVCKDGFIVSFGSTARLYKAPSALDRLSTAQHFPPSPTKRNALAFVNSLEGYRQINSKKHF